VRRHVACFGTYIREEIMAKSASERVMLRLRCCRCGRIDRFVSTASAALTLADELLSAPCPGADGRAGPCRSRDRRLDMHSGQGHSAAHVVS
jgi:hypothetical protein